MEKEREREELRLAEREAERTAKRAKAAQENEAKKQLAMAQRGMTEEQKEVRGKRPSLTIPPFPLLFLTIYLPAPPLPLTTFLGNTFLSTTFSAFFFFFFTLFWRLNLLQFVIQKLMKEHEANMAKFEENLRKEQERTKAALREKLEARRKKKKDAEMQKIKASAKIETEAAEQKEREEMTALQKQEAERLKASTPTTPSAPSETRQRSTGNI